MICVTSVAHSTEDGTDTDFSKTLRAMPLLSGQFYKGIVGKLVL